MRSLHCHLTRLFSIGMLSVFLCVLAVETFHHHDNSEDINCSICSFQQNASQSTPTPVFPHLETTFQVFACFEVVQAQPSFLVREIRQGRAPPSFLLS